MSFDDQPGESGVVKAAAKWDPSGGVNPEWLYKTGDDFLGQDYEPSQGRVEWNSILGLMLAIAFVFIAILSW